MSTDERASVLPSSIQIGVVVKDIEETTKFLSGIWGIDFGDIKELAYTKENLVVGEPFKIKVAYANLGEAKLEIIQPLEGKSIFSEFLTVKGEGLFNINFRLSNYNEMVSKLDAHKGNKMILGIAKERRYSYFEIKPGGVVVEYAET
jgi:hypothetical protein